MRRSLRFLPILFAVVAVGWVYLTSETFVNPETGRKAHVGLSDTQEQQLGLQSFREVVSHSSLVYCLFVAGIPRLARLQFVL